MSREDNNTTQLEELDTTLFDTDTSGDAAPEKKVYYGNDAINVVSENIGRPLSLAEQRVVQEEGYVATPYLDTKGILTQGVGQTGEWIEKGFEASFNHHVERAMSRVDQFEEYPEEVQAELIQAEYRGDLGGSPKFLSYLNDGDYNQASLEFLDNKDYRESKKSGSGVHKRMERVSESVANLAEQRRASLGLPEKKEAVPEAALEKADFKVGNSGYEVVDGDTFRNTQTGKKFRFPGIDLLETDKVLREGGFVRGEAGGFTSKVLIASLLNKKGFTIPVVTDKDAGYDRKIGDFKDANGNLASDYLISTGIARPSFIGKSRKTMSDDQFNRHLYNVGERFLMGDDRDMSDGDIAAALIRAASLQATGGQFQSKILAFDEAEYATMPELYSGVMLRNKNATMENRSKTPFSSSWDSALMLVGSSFQQFAIKGLDTLDVGEDYKTYLQASIGSKRTEMGRKPKVLLDVKDVDFTSLDDITEYLGANIAMSLPFMGVTAASIFAAPFTKGTSLAIPVTMYSGMILDEMEGDVDQKAFSAALAGGSVAAALDVVGLKGVMGLIRPDKFVTKEGREEAIKAFQSATGTTRDNIIRLGGLNAANIGARNLTRQEAQQALSRLSKRQIVAFSQGMGDAVQNQLKASNLLKSFSKRLAVGAAFEGSTELLQELTQYTAAVIGSEKEWNYDELTDRMINAVAAGGMLGAGFTVPVSAWEAGSWKDATVAMREYDGRFDDVKETYKNEERQKYGGVYLPSLEEVIYEEWQSVSQPQPSMVTTEEEVGEAQEFEDKANRGQAKKDERTTGERLTDALKAPQALLISALDKRLTKDLMDRSQTLRRIYSMFGGRSRGVFEGVDFHSSKVKEYTRFENKLPVYNELMSSFKLDSSRKGRRRNEISTIMYGFYKDHVEPITARYKVEDGVKKRINSYHMSIDTIISKIDWDNLKTDKYQKNSDQIKEFLKALYEADQEMFFAISEAQGRVKGLQKIGNLQDHVFRSKSLNKGAIAANKEAFISELVSEYKLDRGDASELTEIILDNPEVNDLAEAFDLTKGGAVPATSKRRSLNLADNEAFQDYFEQNLFNNLDRSMKGSSRYITTLTYLGPNSSLINSMLNKVYLELKGEAESGSTRDREAKETVEMLASDIRDLVNADSGNYKRIKSPAVRGAQKFTTLVGVLTMLPLAAPMSLVEFALTPFDVNVKTLNKNVGSLGIVLGREFYEYFSEMGRLMGVAPKRTNFDTSIEKRKAYAESDPRFVDYANPRNLLRRVGYLDQKTGQAQLVGVSEANELTQAIMDTFFKVIGLTSVTNATRTVRATFFNDFLISNLDILSENLGRSETNATKEARRQLEKYGIPVDDMLLLSEQLISEGKNASPELLEMWKVQFDNGLFNFINSAVPLPDAMGRPLFYSNPHLALFTQFQGFISKFTAHHIPRLWDSVKTSTPGFRYSTFATLMSMLMLGYAAQHLKDLIKFGETSPYLTDNEKYLRALYSSGLLGTTERVLSNNFLFPLYKDRSRNIVEGTWNLVSGEAPASSLVENAYGSIRGLLEDDSRKFVKSLTALTPAGPFKHRIYDSLVENQWITGDN